MDLQRRWKNTVNNTFQVKQHIPINQETYPLYQAFQITEIYMELGEGGIKGLSLQTEKTTTNKQNNLKHLKMAWWGGKDSHNWRKVGDGDGGKWWWILPWFGNSSLLASDDSSTPVSSPTSTIGSSSYWHSTHFLTMQWEGEKSDRNLHTSCAKRVTNCNFELVQKCMHNTDEFSSQNIFIVEAIRICFGFC